MVKKRAVDLSCHLSVELFEGVLLGFITFCLTVDTV